MTVSEDQIKAIADAATSAALETLDAARQRHRHATLGRIAPYAPSAEDIADAVGAAVAVAIVEAMAMRV